MKMHRRGCCWRCVHAMGGGLEELHAAIPKSPETIGLLMSFAGGTTIIFQVFVFQALKARLGNLRTYQNALLGVAVTMEELEHAPSAPFPPAAKLTARLHAVQ